MTGAEKKKVMEAKSRSFTPAQMRIDRRAMYEMVCRQASCRPPNSPNDSAWLAVQRRVCVMLRRHRLFTLTLTLTRAPYTQRTPQ